MPVTLPTPSPARLAFPGEEPASKRRRARPHGAAASAPRAAAEDYDLLAGDELHDTDDELAALLREYAARHASED